MSKTKPSRTASASTGRRKPRSSQRPSLLIPVLVGAVALVILAGAAISLTNRAPASAGSGDTSANADTAQPLPTQPIPNPNVPRVSLEEAQARLEQGRAVLIDVRSRESYDQAHAAGALSFPEEEIDARLGELPRDKDLILYCT